MSATLTRRIIREAGTTYCNDGDLVAAIIGDEPRARKLLENYGGKLAILAQLEAQDLIEAGLSDCQAATLKAALSLALRVQAEALKGIDDRMMISGPAEIAALLRETMRDLPHEELHVLLVDTKHNLIKDVTVTRGLVDRSQAHAREVYREAIRENCTRIILAHNHPSGDPTPSAEDLAITRDLVAAGRIIGIEMMDHIVLGKRTTTRVTDYLSFREQALL